jgi:hypothetical protein
MLDNRASHIARVANQYQALKHVLEAFDDDDEDAPEALLDRATLLVWKLTRLQASTGEELAHKASVLLDWIDSDDLPSRLAASLCRDTVRAFPAHTYASRRLRLLLLRLQGTLSETRAWAHRLTVPREPACSSAPQPLHAGYVRQGYPAQRRIAGSRHYHGRRPR